MNFVQETLLGKTRIPLKFFFIAAIWETGVAQTASFTDTFVDESGNMCLRDFYRLGTIF